MQSKDIKKLILKTKEFIDSSSFLSLLNAQLDVVTDLKTKNEYEVKSDVSTETFKSFIDFMIKGIPPEINDDNISEFEKLSEEFCYMENNIYLYKYKQKSKNCLNIELLSKNQQLTKQLDQKKKLLTDLNSNYRQMIQFLFNDNNYNISCLPQYRSNIFNFMDGNIDLIKNIRHETIVIIDDLELHLNKENSTAFISNIFDNQSPFQVLLIINLKDMLLKDFQYAI